MKMKGYSERRVVEFWPERGLYVCNTYFKHTWVARGPDRVEIESMIDLVLVKKDMLRYVQDVRAVRGME